MSDTVLIIETDREAGNTIRLMAEAAGYQATNAYSVDAALTILSRHHFDVLLTNRLFVSNLKMVSLPWLAKQMQPTLTIVLTASGEPVNVNEVRALDGCMPKPFSIADITRTLATRAEQKLPQSEGELLGIT